MLNKNGKTLLFPTNVSKQGTIKHLDGTTTTIGLSEYARRLFSDAKAKIVLGSGNNAPTIDDYCIEEEIEDLTVISSTVANRDTTTLPYDNNFIVSGTLTVKNNTNAPITVKEVAFYVYWDGAAWGDNKYYMVARDVISPVVIGVGKTYTFSLTIG